MLTKTINRCLPYLRGPILRSLLKAKRWWRPPPYPSIHHCLRQYSEVQSPVFVVQAGAGKAQVHDPIFQYLSLNHWKGLFIEPQPDSFRLLQQSYRHFDGLILENVALSNQEGIQPFYSIQKTPELPDWIDQLSSFRPAIPAAVLEQFPQAKLQTTNISCKTLNQIIEQHQIQKVHLLVLDVEGYEAIILKSYDFKAAVPDLILFEHCHLSATELAALQALLKEQQYLLFQEGFNTLAIGHRVAPEIRESYARFCNNNQK